MHSETTDRPMIRSCRRVWQRRCGNVRSRNDEKVYMMVHQFGCSRRLERRKHTVRAAAYVTCVAMAPCNTLPYASAGAMNCLLSPLPLAPSSSRIVTTRALSRWSITVAVDLRVSVTGRPPHALGPISHRTKYDDAFLPYSPQCSGVFRVEESPHLQLSYLPSAISRRRRTHG